VIAGLACGIALVILFGVADLPYCVSSKGEVMNLSDNAGDTLLPELAISSTNVHAVWDDDTNETQEFRILSKSSPDCGATFLDTTMVGADIQGRATEPDISSSGRNVYVAWQQWDENDDMDIFFARSDDGGVSFHSSLKIYGNPVTRGSSPQLTSEGSDVSSIIDLCPSMLAPCRGRFSTAFRLSRQ